MNKVFRPSFRYYVLINLFCVLFFPLFLIFFVNYGIGLVSLIVSIPLALILIGYFIYVNSYRLTIAEDGKLLESQLLRRNREILIPEIEIIKSKIRPIFLALPGWPVFANVGPIFLNTKYKVFPRYRVSATAVDQIRGINPQIVIDTVYEKNYRRMDNYHKIGLGSATTVLFFGV